MSLLNMARERTINSRMSAIIETPRLLLRNWTDADAEPLHRLCSDPLVMEFFPKLLTREESDATLTRLKEHFDRHGYGFFAAELRATGEFIGFNGMCHTPYELPFTPCVEVGWRLSAEHWNRGLATEGARAVVRHCFDTLGLDEIVSFAVTANIRSRRVMEKLGMTHDPADDFDHPALPEGHPFRRHVLFRLRRRPVVAT
jgi:RimJ/RimL family protein N-acetyltransferase